MLSDSQDRGTPTVQGFRRLLGIDYGSRRVGLSLSDPLGVIAQPYGMVKNDASMWKELREVVEREKVALLVVGMPYNLKGDKSDAADRVERFVDELHARLSIEVVVWDERFTTTMAQHTMHVMGTKRSERRSRKGRLDAMAAALILQSYLDSTKHSRAC